MAKLRRHWWLAPFFLAPTVAGGAQGEDPALVYPQFVIGGGFEVNLILANTDSRPFEGLLRLPHFGAGSNRAWLAEEWVQRVEIELFPFDAGTDSGVSYTSANQDTQPPEPIRQITGHPFLNGATVPPLGSFTFERIDE